MTQKVLDLVQWYPLAPSCQRLHRITVFDNDQKVLDLVQWYPFSFLLPAVRRNVCY